MSTNSTDWQAIRDRVLDWASTSGDLKALSPTTLWRYYVGDQFREDRIPAEVRRRMQRLAQTAAQLGFSLNVCGLFVDRRVGGLRVSGLRAADDASQPAADALDDLWREANIASRVYDAALCACVTGDAYLMPDYDAQGNPTVYVRQRYDGETGVEVVNVDGAGEIDCAYFRFTETRMAEAGRPGIMVRAADYLLAKAGILRDRPPLTKQEVQWRYVYEADGRLRRFVRYAGQTERLADRALDGRDGDVMLPYGMPIVRLTHPKGGELTGTLLGLQDMVNDLALQIAHSAGTDAFRLLVGLDVEPAGSMGRKSEDATPGVGKIGIAPGSVLMLKTLNQARQGSFTSLPPSNLSELRATLGLLMQTASWLAQHPSYLVPGADAQLPPSGRALRIANEASDEATQRLQDRWGARLVQLNDLLERMAGRPGSHTGIDWQGSNYGDAQEDSLEASALVTAGADPETIFERLNFTAEQKARALGYTDEVAAAREQRAQATADALAQAVGGKVVTDGAA